MVLIRMDLIRKQMAELKCPFTWNMDKIGDYDKLRAVKNSIEELSNEFNDESPIRMFIRYLILMYELSRINGKLETMKEDMEKYRKKALLLFEYEPMKNYENVFRHVLLSTEAHALLCTNASNPESLNEAINKIPTIDEDDDLCKAALFGLKATLLSVCHTQLVESVVCNYAREAIKLDPIQAEWHFLLGKALSRVRRRVSRYELPTKEELDELEKAVQLSNSPMYLVFLGQSYGEMVSVLNLKNRKNPDCTINERYHRTAQRCLEILHGLTRSHEEWYIQLRCGITYMELPYPYTRLVLAQKCFSKAEATNKDNEFLLHQYSRLYSKLEDFENAQHYSKLAAEKGVYVAEMDYIRLSTRMYPDFDVIGEIDENIHRYTGEELCGLLCTKGAYYMFKERNIEEGVRFFVCALRVPVTKDYVLKKFCPPFTISSMRGQREFSVYSLLYELIQKLKKSNFNVKINKKEIIEILNSKVPDVSKNTYLPFLANMVNDILKSTVGGRPIRR